MTRVLFFALMTILFSPYCLADAARANFDHCFDEAGARYGLSPELLRTIARVESAMNPMAHNPNNKNGSEDVGLMQINSRWFPILEQHGIERSDLWDPCTSIHVGAWVLAKNIRSLGNTWRAIGAYNAKSEHKRYAYANRIYRNLPCRSGGLRC